MLESARGKVACVAGQARGQCRGLVDGSNTVLFLACEEATGVALPIDADPSAK